MGGLLQERTRAKSEAQSFCKHCDSVLLQCPTEQATASPYVQPASSLLEVRLLQIFLEHTIIIWLEWEGAVFRSLEAPKGIHTYDQKKYSHRKKPNL